MSRTLITSSIEGITDGQKKQIRRVIDDGADEALQVAYKKIQTGKEGAKRILAAGGKLKKAVMRAIIANMVELSFIYSEQVAAWSVFYKKHFNLELDFSNLRIPDHQEGHDRLIIVPQELAQAVSLPGDKGNNKKRVQPINWAFMACQQQFTCWESHTDLDVVIPINDRHPKNGTYAIWVRDRQEADEENKNLSANALQGRGIHGTTVLEGELYQLKFFDETGKHLDIKNVSLHSGSRGVDGDVPGSGWSGGTFFVFADWDDPDVASDYLRARSVVSVPAEQSDSGA